MRDSRSKLAIATVLAAFLSMGCSKLPAPGETSQPARHHHHPPHGGTPVELGDEEYHIELVLDDSRGTLQAYVLDGEMENFIRSSAPAIEISSTQNGTTRSLVLAAVANPETGETVGDSALFEAPAGWVKSSGAFEAVLKAVTIRGSTFTNVKFSFPKGNDTDG